MGAAGGSRPIASHVCLWLLRLLQAGAYQLEAQRSKFVSTAQLAFVVLPDQAAADELRQLESDPMGALCCAALCCGVLCCTASTGLPPSWVWLGSCRRLCTLAPLAGGVGG